MQELSPRIAPSLVALMIYLFLINTVFDFPAKDHVTLAENLGIVDFKLGEHMM
jgi:hypothetical protein